MQLFHVPMTRSMRVLWALEESGAPFDLVVLERADTQSAEHLDRHPLGRVPVAKTDEGFVFESGALCLHIADLYPQMRLTGPPGSRDRALVYQWVAFALTEFDANLGLVMRETDVDPDRAAFGAERFRTAATAVDSALAGREFLVGDRFTVADVMCGEQLALGTRFGLVEGLANVEAYVDRLRDRPAFKRAEAVGAD